ncbi:MAG TPA: ferredoxin--NADP reductase [Candidatus Dormibacteraeota bacterium]|nr:ferredoxin--NADP reductase [Candidatus Dormibacteraeota bacterium]
MKVVFDHSKPETDHIRSFFFRAPESLKYTPGQFIELKLDHRDPDSRGQKRWFTLSSSPSEELLAITTKLASQRGSSFKRILDSLQPGTEVDMVEPMGDFVLPKLIQTPLVFVAGGIGITPFRSMLKWLADSREIRPIQLIYGVRSEDEIVFQKVFEEAGVHATIVVSEPSTTWGGERGRINAELILGLTKPSEQTLIYVSGPEPMVEGLEKDLAASGLPKSRFVGDFFPGYSAI